MIILNPSALKQTNTHDMSTKKQTVKKIKLSKGLPPLPPVPKGYDTWEYLGKGPLKIDLIREYSACVGEEDERWLGQG